jgi:class 3 adenylate cyclase
VPPQQERRVERRLAATFAADVAGYSRLMSQNEAGTLRALAAAREVMDGVIAEHGGRIANTAGDSVLAEFPSAGKRYAPPLRSDCPELGLPLPESEPREAFRRTRCA